MKPASGFALLSRTLNRMVPTSISSPLRHDRRLFLFGALGGIAGSWALEAISPNVSFAQAQSDLAILNGVLELEHEAIWAYTVASGKLSNQAVGKTILAVAMSTLKDHQHHRDVLSGMIQTLGETPVTAQDKYDLSSYTEAGEGNLDSDLNIAKLALALEYDAALAYVNALSQLSAPKLIAEVGTIGPAKSAHAAALRAIFHAQDPSISVIPSAFMSADTRDQWILKV